MQIAATPAEARTILAAKTRVNALTTRGERMKVDLFAPEWDFWAATREPIETVRASASPRN
jgi:hypothetical protein